jgi:hypothetical protein
MTQRYKLTVESRLFYEIEVEADDYEDAYAQAQHICRSGAFTEFESIEPQSSIYDLALIE